MKKRIIEALKAAKTEQERYIIRWNNWYWLGLKEDK
jgi:hypothetical protein